MIEEQRANLLYNSDFNNSFWDKTKTAVDKPDIQPPAYVLSCRVAENVPVLVHRPWWKFWAHDKMETRASLVHRFHLMSKDEGEFLMDAFNGRGVGMRALQIVLQKPTHIQMEYGSPATSYIPTTTQRTS